MEEGRPISYEALSVGTAVLSSTNSQFGTVEHVLQIPELDLFDGIAVKTKHGLRFVDRDQKRHHHDLGALFDHRRRGGIPACTKGFTRASSRHCARRGPIAHRPVRTPLRSGALEGTRIAAIRRSGVTSADQEYHPSTSTTTSTLPV